MGVAAYDPEFLPAGDLLAMATIESANVLCADDLIGSLEVGKAADLVLLDGNAPHLLATHHLPSDLVRFATRAGRSRPRWSRVVSSIAMRVHDLIWPSCAQRGSRAAHVRQLSRWRRSKPFLTFEESARRRARHRTSMMAAVSRR